MIGIDEVKRNNLVEAFLVQQIKGQGFTREWMSLSAPVIFKAVPTI